MRKVLMSLAALVGMAGVAHAGDLEVTITGVEARGGVLLIGVQTEGQFMQPAGVGEMITVTEAGSVSVTFPNLPPGEYALSVLHDENGDYQMALGPDGMPQEGWAMSNGEALRGPPTFADVRFTIPAEGLQVTEAMQYPAQ
jgi:uncharacterized protein (DUF2141 family)